MADTSKQCTITNNSDSNVVVLLAVEDGQTSNTGAVPVANGTLEVLKTTSGDTIIKKGSSGTITLDHSYTSGSAGAVYVQQYNLIVSNSNWLYPLASLPVLQQGENGSTGYAPQTVSSNAETPMTQAFAFYQTITAYPDSALTKEYLTALQEAKDAAAAKADGSANGTTVAEAIWSRLAAFFQGTKDYARATLTDVVAVDDYYNAFPAVWAQYKDGLTYYLYGSDGTAATFAGTLSLQKNGPMDVTKPAGGYTCKFNPARTPADTSKTDVDEAGAVTLTYADGLFTDDPAAAAPHIALKGSFLLQRKFTGNPADTNTLPVMVGKVAGVPIIGFDAPQSSNAPHQPAGKLTLTSTDWHAFWNTLIQPKTQNDMIKSAAIFLSMIAAIPVAAATVVGAYKFVQIVRDILSRKEVDEVFANQTKAANRESVLKFGQICDGEWKEADFNEIQKEDALFENNLAKGKLFDGIVKQHESLKAMLEFYSEIPAKDFVTLQEALTEIRTSAQSLNNATDDTLADVLKSEVARFSTRQTSINNVFSNVKGKLSGEAAGDAEESLALSAKTATELAEATKNREQEQTEMDPYVKDVLIPELRTL